MKFFEMIEYLTDVVTVQEGSTWQHSEGGTYVVIGHATNEDDRVQVVVYREVDGDQKMWVCPLAEFVDGRFILILTSTHSASEPNPPHIRG